jgi:hypothetical protein
MLPLRQIPFLFSTQLLIKSLKYQYKIIVYKL